MTTISEAKTTQYEPPTADIHDAVCCEFIDLGMQKSPYNGEEKHQGVFVFQVAERNEPDAVGKSGRKQVRLWFNMTFGNEAYPSKIRKILGSWLGQPLSQVQLRSFQIETLVGKPCRLVVSHGTGREGRTVAKVDNVLPPGETELSLEDYSPSAERVEKTDPSPPSEQQTAAIGDPPVSSEDDIPF